jgi:glutathione S-transferase
MHAAFHVGAVDAGSRDELREATGDTKLPALKLPDGTTVTHSRAILAWISRQRRFPRRGPAR